MTSSHDDIVPRLRALASEFPTVNGWMDNEWTNAADEIERLRNELASNADKLRAEDKPTHRLGTGQRRLYIVQARDYMGGTVAPSRIANAASLAAMVERCIGDIMGNDAKSICGDNARPDGWVTICACDMEVSDE